jgi:hypothetical protein
LIAFPAWALDEVTDVEIKLALKPIRGHGVFYQDATFLFN